MNKDQKEIYQTTQLRKKYDSIHLLSGLGLERLSGLYLTSFYNSSKRYNVILPSQIKTGGYKFCDKCGCLRIPNRNVIIKSNTTDMSFECLACGNIKRFENIRKENTKNEHPVKEGSPSNFIATWPANKMKPTSDNKIEKKNRTAKDRNKKRKMHSLSNMLSKKNNDKKKNNSNSLSLEDFMSI